MKMRSLLMILTAVIAVVALASLEDKESSFSSPHFTGLGDLPGGRFFSTAKSVSADGAVVVGYSQSAEGEEAFRWTPAEGIVALSFSHASAVSADGNTVVGYRRDKGRAEPVRWTTRHGVQGLETLTNNPNGEACAVAANGATIVGAVATIHPDFGDSDTAFRWTPDRGIALLERAAAAAFRSEAYDVSANGVVVVGVSQSRKGHHEAFRWTAETGPVGLGFLPGHNTSVAYGVSEDGSVVVGCSSDHATSEAFRWTCETGMVRLGSRPRIGHDSGAQAVSDDGSVIVGYRAGENGWDAFIWDAARGVRSIREVLESDFPIGNKLRGWKLNSAMAVSGDGTVVVGFGLNRRGNQEAWLARFTDPTTGVTPMLPLGNDHAASRRWPSDRR